MKPKFIRIFLFMIFLLFSSISCQPQFETVTTDNFQIKQLSSYPIFEMDYFSDYRQSNASSLDQNSGAFACSVFSAPNSSGGYIMGRNFDWEHNAVLILHTSPSDGYSSVSTVNLGFLGIGVDQAEDLLTEI